MEYFVYILSNQTNVAIYTGITNNLERRLWEHKNYADPGSFTARYKINKEIKSWSRKKKNKLIESKNPNWNDLKKTDCHASVRTGSQ